MAAVSLFPPRMSGHQQVNQDRQDLPRPYKCPLCDKAFHRLEHQTRHIRTHTGEKPHACSFRDCTKRFSRSDELTRHLRIHNNPNGRRNSHRTSQMSPGTGLPENSNMMSSARMMPPPSRVASHSAPTSNSNSPDVSPPGSYSAFHPHLPMPLGPYSRHETHSNPMDINVLASAASHVERNDGYSVSAPLSRQPFDHQHQMYDHRAPVQISGRLPPLVPYASSQMMARTYSSENRGVYSHRAKRSRPNSPNSTAPTSPAQSHESLSPTPDVTPSATPAHSPRLRPYDMHLPGIRDLTIGHGPILAPMEPSHGGLTQPTQHSQPSGSSLGDLFLRQDAPSRRLPAPQVPKMTVQDILNPGYGPDPGTSNYAFSRPGDAMMLRR